MHAFRELTETVEANMQLRKQVSELTVQTQQQVSVKKVGMLNKLKSSTWLQSQATA